MFLYVNIVTKFKNPHKISLINFKNKIIVFFKIGK